MKVLLSYPRSGNHLVRFFIELLTERPTFGCIGNKNDIPIFENKFPKKVLFNIKKDESNKSQNYRKFHIPPNVLSNHTSTFNKHLSMCSGVKNNNTLQTENTTTLIFIVRNPREVLPRNLDYRFNEKIAETYFTCLDYFNNFERKKCIFYYEDLITEKNKFIDELYNFLEVKNISKKEYVLENLDELYEISKKGTNRSWGGVKSNGVNYHYEKLNKTEKKLFDDYIKRKLDTNKYDIIKHKYFSE